MPQAHPDAIAEVRSWSGYALSVEAGCMHPDSHDSPGAHFLYHVMDATLDAIVKSGDDFDADDFTINGEQRQIADDAPSIYTGQLWAEFTDLGAWQEDPTELGGDISDMEQGARVCLYIIADRLASAIVQQVAEWEDES